MVERFPFGKAPFWLLLVALFSTVLVFATQRLGAGPQPDLVLATFAANHVEAYQDILPAFERKHGVKVSIQLVHQRALQTRLQNALLAGTPVPDLVELLGGDIQYFTRGPLKDVGLVDFTERLEREGLRGRLVESRLSLWSSRGHVFALPHDVHPVMLAYRADLLAEAGVDPTSIETWDDFVALRPKVMKDLNGDGVIDRYLIDLPIGEAWGLEILLLQQGVSLFDAEGNLQMDQPRTVETIAWYVRAVEGKDRIATQCGWGQPLYRAMKDGLALFYMAPDWRTRSFEMEAPNLANLFKLMPLPAWRKGERRTSVWGGSGLAITKQTKRPELAWELAKTLYFDTTQLGRRFQFTNIIPPLKDSWSLPEFAEKNDFYQGQQIGLLYAGLASDAPADWSTPYKTRSADRLGDVFLRALEHYRAHGNAGLEDTIRLELKRVAVDIQRYMGRFVLAKR
jgi:arabinosaccharide transport system substrate-binding protein